MSDNYNATRDQYMYEKAEWFLQHGDNAVLFINGHNGHIGKTSVAGYICLGKLLSENLGNGYYSIGTDAAAQKHSAACSGDLLQPTSLCRSDWESVHIAAVTAALSEKNCFAPLTLTLRHSV